MSRVTGSGSIALEGQVLEAEPEFRDAAVVGGSIAAEGLATEGLAAEGLAADGLAADGLAPIDAGTDADGALDGAAATPFFYDWVMLPIAMATLIASSPGQTFGVSIFNEAIRESLALSHGQLAAAYMLGTLLGALPIAFIGRQMDRYGLRNTLLAIITLFSLACFLTAAAREWWSLLLAFALLRMLGPGALALLSSNTLPFWFDRRLGLVEGLRNVGMAVAMASIPAFNLWLVTQWGWRTSYLIMGAGLWLVLFPLVARFFRNHPEDLGQRIDGTHPHGRRAAADGTRSRRSETHRSGSHGSAPVGQGPGLAAAGGHASLLWGLTLGETLRTKEFWIVASGTASMGLVHTALFFCMVPIYAERGLGPVDAAATLTVFAVSLAAMQFVGGALADRMPAHRLLAFGMACLSAAVATLYVASSPWQAHASGVILGLGQGIFFGVSQPLWARYFGRNHIGKIRGALMTFNVACSSLGPLIAGLTRDWQGNFSLALLIFVVLPLPIALLSLTVRPPAVPRPA